MRGTRRFVARVGLGVALVMGSSLEHGLARAQATDRVLAEALFREGRELMEKNRVSEACGKFAESHRLDRALGTLINLAVCHEKDGKVATAWVELTDAVAEAAAAQDDREAFARRHLAALEAELPRLRLVVAAANASLASIEIKLDGLVVGQAGWSSALPIDPGEHTIAATAEGRRRFEATVVIPRGKGVTEVNVPALEDAPRLVVPASPPRAPEQGASDSGIGTQRLVGYAVGGVGVVGVAVGTVFGYRAISLKGDRDERCNSSGTLCDREGLSKDESARTSATLSTVGFVAGAALLAGGLTLVLTAPKRRTTVGLGAAGIVVGGTF